jgi:hypothetical protein
MGKAIKKVAGGAVGSLIGGAVMGPLGSAAGAIKGFTGSGGSSEGVPGGYDPRETAFKIGATQSTLTKEFTDRAKERSAGLQSQADVSAGQRQTLAQQLAAQAAGTAPSLAEAQLRSASDRNLAQQLAAAQATGRGANQSALARNLARNQMTAGAELGQQAAQARMQEQQAAQGQLAQMTGADQATLNQLAAAYESQGFGYLEADQQAQADLEKLRANIATNTQNLTESSRQASKNRTNAIIGGVLGGAGSIGAAALSDEKMKKNVKKASKSDIAKALSESSTAKSQSSSKPDPKKFLESLKAYTYDYKDPDSEGARKGKMLSVMAQDLEGSEAGKEMVSTNEEGNKMVDYAKGYGAILAAQAHLNERLNSLEKKKSSKKRA